MTAPQVVEMSVTVNNNSPIHDYIHPDDQTQPNWWKWLLGSNLSHPTYCYDWNCHTGNRERRGWGEGVQSICLCAMIEMWWWIWSLVKLIWGRLFSTDKTAKLHLIKTNRLFWFMLFIYAFLAGTYIRSRVRKFYHYFKGASLWRRCVFNMKQYQVFFFKNNYILLNGSFAVSCFCKCLLWTISRMIK